MEYILVIIKVLFADWISLSVVHIALLCLFIYSLQKNCRLKRRRRQSSVKATVKRGAGSMGALCFSYGVITTAYALAISASECIGYKATLIIIDYVVLTYIFFFNSWFRNYIVFNKWLKRIRED